MIAKRMVGKPFNIRERDNGEDYEVHLNDRRVGKGTYPRPKGESSFRWGMDLGKYEVKNDAMIFVSGVKFE